MIKRITDTFTPKQYLIVLLFSLIALWGIYLIISWSTYHPFDNAWSVSSSQTEVLNKGGKLGAWSVDVLFVLFGQLANIIPFVLSVAPLYFIRTIRSDALTWKRFALRLFGFALLLCGLSVLAVLWLDNAGNYPAGGVLGAELVARFSPQLGEFGLLISAFVFAVVGFIFCSGGSLIRMLMKLYRWVTMKNEDNAVEGEESESEKTETVMESETVTQTEADDKLLTPESVKDLIKPEQIKHSAPTTPHTTINISGLTVNHITNSEDKFRPEHFADLNQETAEQLPEVKIAVDKVIDWSAKNSPEFLRPDERAMLLQEETSDNDEPMPKVTLSPLHKTTENPTALEEQNAPLAVQFAEQEQQRMAEMAIKAKEMDAEDTLKVILNTPSQQSTETPAYKPYDNSLIHPLLQPKAVSAAKPTTPLPSLDLLQRRPVAAQDITQEEIVETSKRIEQQLYNFNIKATVKDVLIGPVVTRYELELQPGTKASKVTGIDNDLARALMFRSIRVAEVIPGKPYIGIETPNDHRQIVSLRDVLDSDEFRRSDALLPMALGKDISGKPVVIDLAKTPHLLVAGSTGSGKSVGINTMILSLLFRVKPEQVKFIMIDPKVVELSIYNDIPHLLTEVVTDMKKAANALRWCVDEMERRYQLLAHLRVRNIEGYNDKIDEATAMNLPIPDPTWKPGDSMHSMPPALEKLSYIVLIVDEFADLMMVAGKQIEELIARLTQKARAIGIHVILATQRPSVDVITGLIKSNIPSRIAFSVVQRNDSRTILDQNGAEALLGKGDMLYMANGSTDLVRVHGAFMSDDEVARVADDWRARGKPQYVSAILESVEEEAEDEEFGGASSGDLDPLFDQAVEIVMNSGNTSTSFIQRRLKVGFNRAANIMEQMEEQGIVSEMRNGKRELLTRNQDY